MIVRHARFGAGIIQIISTMDFMDIDLAEVLAGVSDGFATGWLDRADAISVVAGFAGCSDAEATRILDSPLTRPGWAPRLIQGGAA